MSQYALDLALPAVFSVDNFFVSDCNRMAWQQVQAWPDWQGHALLLVGPEGSGKTHLGHVWAARARASITAAAELTREQVNRRGHWLVEDVDTLKEERLLFHLFNATRENGGNLLLTATQPAARLAFTLPDLASRLRATPMASMMQPDEAVLAAAMRKQFADRQMKVDEDVIAYLVPRIERSLARIKTLVEILDAEALKAQRGLTIPFVRQLLDTQEPLQ